MISAGLDYPGIGPEHAWLDESDRAHCVATTDVEALEAFQLSCEMEGIIPALEPCDALAHVSPCDENHLQYPSNHLIIKNMCGHGDKSIFTVAKHPGFGLAEAD